MLRLRQICIAVPELAASAAELEAILGIAPCHRDPMVAAFGLENALFPVGPSFIELVAPIRADAAVHRFLARHPGGGGYMAILNCDTLGEMRRHVEALGLRVIHESDGANRPAAQPDAEAALVEALENYRAFTSFQLHPRDTGGTLLELNWTEGGDDLYGPYAPAGRQWQTAAGAREPDRMLAVELRSADAAGLAQRWSRLLRRDLQTDGEKGFRIELDWGAMRFAPNANGEADDALTGVDLRLTAAARALDVAHKRGHAATEEGFTLGGVRFRVVGADG